MAQRALPVFVGLVLAGGCTGIIASPPSDGPGTGLPATGGAPSTSGTGAGGGSGHGSAAGTAGSAPQMAADCVNPPPARSPLRRLTRYEYDNTVHDLLGDDTRPASRFAAEQATHGYDNSADDLSASATLTNQYADAADALAARAALDLKTLTGCASDAVTADAPCLRQFVTAFGRRAFRRPLDEQDTTMFLDLLKSVASTESVRAGVEAVVSAVLQSPEFLYRPELGAPSVALTGYELATRLSYLFWGTMPDESLFAAAADGRLATPSGLKEQAERLLADPRAEPALVHFAEQWLGVTGLLDVAKDSLVFPTWKPRVVPALLQQELRTFVVETVLHGDGRLSSLLTGNYSYVNAPLAAYYGYPGVAGESFTRVTPPGGHTVGLLTQGALMATLAHPDQTAPIKRGKFVIERLFCDELVPPPANLNIKLPTPSPNATTRQRFQEHAAAPVCSSCHSRIDPIGFGFEHLSAIGTWRDVDGAGKVDATGALNGTDVDGPFDGARELGDRLSRSATVQSCVVRQQFRAAFARREDDSDACTLATLDKALSDSNGDIRALMLALVRTTAFTTREVKP